MRRMIWTAAVCGMLGGASAVMACENHRPQEYPKSLEPEYYADPVGEVLASAPTTGGVKLAGVGVGGAMIALAALFARRRR